MNTSERDGLTALAADRLHAGESLDDILRFLRANGATIVESIKTTMTLTDVSLAEAKRIVHNSAAWRDRRADHDAFHRLLEESAEAVEETARRGRTAQR